MGKIGKGAMNWESYRKRETFPQEVEAKGWYSWRNDKQKVREPDRMRRGEIE